MTAVHRIHRGPTGHRNGQSHPKAAVPDSVVAEARARRAARQTYAEIGRALGVNPRTVADWCTWATRYRLDLREAP
jgi:hypothetical protein